MRDVVRYSEAFKLRLVEDAAGGKYKSLDELGRRNGIGDSTTVARWIKQYGREDILPKRIKVETMDEIDEMQAAADTDTMPVAGRYVTDRGNDKRELEKIVREADTGEYTPERVCADAGYFCEEEITAAGKRNKQGERAGPEVYCAVEKGMHHKSVRDIEKREEPEPPAPGAGVKEQMARKLKTKEGKAVYRKRKQTVEPVFGIIKAAMGFRQFLLRGLEKANLEWELVTQAYGIKRLYALKTW